MGSICRQWIVAMSPWCPKARLLTEQNGRLPKLGRTFPSGLSAAGPLPGLQPTHLTLPPTPSFHLLLRPAPSVCWDVSVAPWLPETWLRGSLIMVPWAEIRKHLLQCLMTTPDSSHLMQTPHFPGPSSPLSCVGGRVVPPRVPGQSLSLNQSLAPSGNLAVT